MSISTGWSWNSAGKTQKTMRYPGNSKYTSLFVAANDMLNAQSVISTASVKGRISLPI